MVKHVLPLTRNMEDAEDAVQEALAKLWHYNGKMNICHNIDALSFITVWREALKRIIKKRSSVSLIEIPEPLTEEPNNIKELYDNVVRGIDDLPVTERMVMRLRHIEGLEIEEIAYCLNSTSAAVRTALSRARKKLRSRFYCQKR